MTFRITIFAAAFMLGMGLLQLTNPPPKQDPTPVPPLDGSAPVSTP